MECQQFLFLKSQVVDFSIIICLKNDPVDVEILQLENLRLFNLNIKFQDVVFRVFLLYFI